MKNGNVSGILVLNRVYLLIGLLMLMAAVVVGVLFEHSREQDRMYDKLSNFHTPIIYYTDRLSVTLKDIAQTYRFHQKDDSMVSFAEAMKNPVYEIETYMDAISELNGWGNRNVNEKAWLRLQGESKRLVQILNRLPVEENQEKNQDELLTVLIESALFRAQQLGRLHANSSEKLRLKLADREHSNSKTLLKLTVETLIASTCLVIPLVLSIRKMIRSMELSERNQREHKELAVREQSRMAALLSAMSIGILFEDKQGCAEYINPAFRRMWALEENEPLIGHSLNYLLEKSPQRFVNREHSSKYVLRVLDTHEISERFEIEFNDGRILTQLSYPVLDSEKGVLGRLWIYEDITHERQTAQQLLYLAEHDQLTGLNNRHRFQKHLAFMIESCRRSGGQFALLYFDLDEFKYINDTFGHGIGDSVLLRTASEVSALVRGAEMFARLGGDEFAILTMVFGEDNLGALPERIVRTVSSIPFRFRGTSLRLTASVGVAVYPQHGSNTEDLVAHADAAMYQAKKQGKNTWAVYNPERNDSELMVERMSWSRRIGLALEQNLLELHFQGIYQAVDSQLSHLEVLVRMRDPADRQRLIMPGAFIPFAEKNGQIVEIDRRILAKSIALLAKYPSLPGLAVNISGRSFDEPSLPGYIREQLIFHSVEPKRLIIELTETETVSDIQDAQRFIEAIHQAGCRICLDDFGSGFSTFTYLKYLNVEILKIDGMFVRDLVNNQENQVFVKAMVSIARGLGKAVVAEFVENAETMALLHSFGVQFVQGYYLDRPSDRHPAFAGELAG